MVVFGGDVQVVDAGMSLDIRIQDLGAMSGEWTEADVAEHGPRRKPFEEAVSERKAVRAANKVF